MSKSRGYFFGCKKPEDVLLLKTTWQFDLGMHNFRKAERETLRVRRSSGLKLQRLKPLKERLSECVKPSGNSPNSDLLRKLPFYGGSRRGHIRRLRRRSAHQLNKVRKTAKVLEIPVKVTIPAPKEFSGGRYVEVWQTRVLTVDEFGRPDTTTFQRVVRDYVPYPSKDQKSTGCYDSGHYHSPICRTKFLDEGVCKFRVDQGCASGRKTLSGFTRGNRRRTWKGEGLNRHEKRRAWFNHYVVGVKDKPEKLNPFQVRKRRGFVSKLMGRRKARADWEGDFFGKRQPRSSHYPKFLVAYVDDPVVGLVRKLVRCSARGGEQKRFGIG